eukprot:COSAG02_NODE_36003_length_460_cov_0.933518_1_plen_119_part_01
MQAMPGSELCNEGGDLDDRPKKKLGPGRPRKDAGLTPEQRKHRRCAPTRAIPGGWWIRGSRWPGRRMLSNRVAAKRAYHRRVEKMESLQKENSFLVQVLAERQQRQHKLEALVRTLTAY